MEVSNTQENMGKVGPVIFRETQRACCKQDGRYLRHGILPRNQWAPKKLYIYWPRRTLTLLLFHRRPRWPTNRVSYRSTSLLRQRNHYYAPSQAVLTTHPSYDRSKAHLAIQVWRPRQHRSLTFGPDLPYVSTPPPQRPTPPPTKQRHVRRVSQACTSCRRMVSPLARPIRSLLSSYLLENAL